jgi:hypothetical protein
VNQGRGHRPTMRMGRVSLSHHLTQGVAMEKKKRPTRAVIVNGKPGPMPRIVRDVQTEEIPVLQRSGRT